MFAKQGDVFLHAPFRLVKTIFDGVTDTGKAFQVGRIEPEEVAVFGGFDREGVFQVNLGCWGPSD